jgi:phage baseplate assembly protein gpV
MKQQRSWSMRGSEYEANATNKRGTIVDRDPAKMQVKVQFSDEDDVVSMWIDVLAKSTTGTTTFMMPAMGEEVWCAMDTKGEDGCLIGSKFNNTNRPPFGSNDDIRLIWAGGSVHVNTGSGDISVNTSGTVKIVATAIKLESATLTHNGVDISDKHKHKNVTPGPSPTGKPV